MQGTNIFARYSKIEHTTGKCITQAIALSKKKNNKPKLIYLLGWEMLYNGPVLTKMIKSTSKSPK